MKPVKTHSFQGTRYELLWASDVDGFLEEPGEPRALMVNDKLPPKQLLETLIHEAMHAIEPRMTEKRVDRISGELTRFLWRLGYRSHK